MLQVSFVHSSYFGQEGSFTSSWLLCSLRMTSIKTLHEEEGCIYLQWMRLHFQSLLSSHHLVAISVANVGSILIWTELPKL